MSSHKLHISDDGTIRAIYSDDLGFLDQAGKASINRVSRVEPDEFVPFFWRLDMSPIGLGSHIGVFSSRQAALDYEQQVLELVLSGQIDPEIAERVRV